MSIKTVRALVLGFFLIYLLAITWPVVTLFKSGQPLIFGLPLSMAWAVLWIVLGGVALAILDWFECREEDRQAGPGAGKQTASGQDEDSG
jgi:hypothetical protein